jgi:hypothetical protein
MYALLQRAGMSGLRGAFFRFFDFCATVGGGVVDRFRATTVTRCGSSGSVSSFAAIARWRGHGTTVCCSVRRRATWKDQL